jgi:ubiquinone/menaquinone biosynthesis C-methylase UbiE
MFKNIWDKFNDIFSKTIIAPQFYLKKYESKAIETILKTKGNILVDIGCGRQKYKSDLLKKYNKYIGVDHPDVSRKYLNKDKPDILADAANLPLKNNYADATIMISVLEHLPKPQEALNEAFRITKKGGLICLITVQNYILHDAPYDYFRYTRFSLEKMLVEAGYKSVKIKPLGNYFELTGQYFNVFLLYKIKVMISGKNLLTKTAGVILLPVVEIVCIISNIFVYIFNLLFKNDKEGQFAIYNLAVAKKLK